MTAGWRNRRSGWKRSPARWTAGISTSAIAAMPAVAPSPSVHRSRSSSRTSVSDHCSAPGSGSDSSVTMMITLGRIGLHAAAKNRRRELRMAFASPVAP